MMTLTPTADPASSPPVRSSRTRLAWTGVGLAVAVVVVAALVLTGVGNVAYQTIPTRQRVFSTPLTAVNVDVGTGSVTVQPRSGPGAVVTTSGTFGVTSPTDVERVTGSTLAIRSECGSVFFDNRCDRNYVLQVQSSVSVRIDTGEGDIDVDGLSGVLAVHSGQGDIAVSGGGRSIRATTGQGNISASGVGAQDLFVQSGQGDIDLDFKTPPTRVAATSGQGNVTVELPRGPVTYQVNASSGQGSISTPVAENPLSRHVLMVNSGQGDVTVRYRSGGDNQRH
jgi:Putative adhesin